MPVVFAFAFYVTAEKTDDVIFFVLQGKDDAVFKFVVMCAVVVASF